MSLEGTYTCASLDAKLVITKANNTNGEGTGTLTIGDLTMEVNIHYHFNQNVGPDTVIEIWGSNFYGYDYTGAAGFTKDTNGASGIMLAGGFGNASSVQGFSGLFKK
jgi:hypothetical protein